MKFLLFAFTITLSSCSSQPIKPTYIPFVSQPIFIEEEKPIKETYVHKCPSFIIEENHKLKSCH